MLNNIIIENYNLPNFILEPWTRGYVGETYVLKTPVDRYFVKIVKISRFSENVEMGLMALKELHELGVNQVNYPIPTINNNLSVIFDDKLLCIFNFIDGTGGFDYDFEKYVSLLALIHSKTVSIKTLPKKEDFSISFLGDLESQMLKLTQSKFVNPYQLKLQKLFIENQSWFTPFLPKLRNLSLKLGRQQFEFVLTHGDAPGNILQSPNGEVFLIDWDDLMLSPRERDTWFHLTNEKESSKFLAIYNKTFPSHKPNWELCEFYTLRRFFDDFECNVSKILSDEETEDGKEKNLNLFLEDCLGWFKPLLKKMAI